MSIPTDRPNEATPPSVSGRFPDETYEWWAREEARNLLTRLAVDSAVESVSVRWRVRVDEPHPKRREQAGAYIDLHDARTALAARRIWEGWTPGYFVHIQLADGTEINGPWTERLVCCDMHNTNCEPPSELCCWYCTEVTHPKHNDLVPCVLDGGAS